MSQQMIKSCIEACLRCAQECDRCVDGCLKEDDVNAMVACIRLDLDCAAICRLVPSFLLRGSAFSRDLCRLCAEICSACGAECAKHKAPHCQECAMACQKCAAECHQMVEATS